MNRKALVPAIVLTLFVAFSSWVVAQEGYFGFVTLAVTEPWGGQIFLDLCIALVLVSGWLIRDARSRGINPWPYVLTIPLLGSIPPLAYLVVRSLKKPAELSVA